MPGWWFVLAFVMSIVFSGIIGIALLTYIRRTLQLIRADNDDSIQNRILDGIDQLQTRMDLISDRLDRLGPGFGPDPDRDRLGGAGEGE